MGWMLEGRHLCLALRWEQRQTYKLRFVERLLSSDGLSSIRIHKPDSPEFEMYL